MERMEGSWGMAQVEEAVQEGVGVTFQSAEREY